MSIAFDPAPALAGRTTAATNDQATNARVTVGPRTIVPPVNRAAGRETLPILETKRGLAPMISRQKEQIRPATDHVLGGDWAITPLLTAGDNVGLELADISIQAGYSTIGTTGKTAAGYYCLSGEAIYRNLETQTTHYFRAGSLWTIPAHTRFRFTALFPLRLIAVATARAESENGADDAPYFPLLNK